MAKFDTYTAIGRARWAGITEQQVIDHIVDKYGLIEKDTRAIRRMFLDQYLDNMKHKQESPS